jgi:hypothetical protein
MEHGHGPILDPDGKSGPLDQIPDLFKIAGLTGSMLTIVYRVVDVAVLRRRIGLVLMPVMMMFVFWMAVRFAVMRVVMAMMRAVIVEVFPFVIGMDVNVDFNPVDQRLSAPAAMQVIALQGELAQFLLQLLEVQPHVDQRAEEHVPADPAE